MRPSSRKSPRAERGNFILARAIVQAVTHYNDPKVMMEVSTGLGPAMVGISDIKGDPVNFRDREGGEYVYEGKVPPKKALHGHTETKMYGSSWNH